MAAFPRELIFGKGEPVGSRFITICQDHQIGMMPGDPPEVQMFRLQIPNRVPDKPRTNYHGVTGVFRYWMPVTLDEIAKTAETLLLRGDITAKERSQVKRTLGSVDARAARAATLRAYTGTPSMWNGNGRKAVYEAFLDSVTGRTVPTERQVKGRATHGLLWPYRTGRAATKLDRPLVIWLFFADGEPITSRKELVARRVQVGVDPPS